MTSRGYQPIGFRGDTSLGSTFRHGQTLLLLESGKLKFTVSVNQSPEVCLIFNSHGKARIKEEENEGENATDNEIKEDRKLFPYHQRKTQSISKE